MFFLKLKSLNFMTNWKSTMLGFLKQTFVEVHWSIMKVKKNSWCCQVANLVCSSNNVICLGYEALQYLLEWENSVTTCIKIINKYPNLIMHYLFKGRIRKKTFYLWQLQIKHHVSFWPVLCRLVQRKELTILWTVM